MIFRTLLLQFLVVLFAISMSDAVSAAEGMARADETVDHDERKTAHWRGAISPAQETNARMTVWAKSGRTFKYSKPGNGAGLSWDTITDTSSKAAFEAIVLASANHPKSYSPTFGGEFEVEGSGGGPGTTPTWNVDGTLMVDGHQHYREWREDFANTCFSLTINGRDATDPASWGLPAAELLFTISTGNATQMGNIVQKLWEQVVAHSTAGTYGLMPRLPFGDDASTSTLWDIETCDI